LRVDWHYAIVAIINCYLGEKYQGRWRLGNSAANSAAIPLPAGGPKLSQGTDKHTVFGMQGLIFHRQIGFSLISGKC
jgi:hypothetical protein